MSERPYVVAFVLTLAVEVPIWSLLGSWASGASRGRAALVGAVANGVSHPLLWFVFVPAVDAATGAIVLAVALAEVVVLVIKGRVAWRLLPTGPVVAGALALVANAASLAVGLLVLR